MQFLLENIFLKLNTKGLEDKFKKVNWQYQSKNKTDL